MAAIYSEVYQFVLNLLKCKITKGNFGEVHMNVRRLRSKFTVRSKFSYMVYILPVFFTSTSPTSSIIAYFKAYTKESVNT